MLEIKGKKGISAKIIVDSIGNDTRLITYELTYPRFIHSELMTHRMFSRNASSSRAIPIEKFLKQIDENPASPVYWGRNQPGMQASEELDDESKSLALDVWITASQDAMKWASKLEDLGLHKQISNRLLEPWQFMKTIVTATEWENFFDLRSHPAAQPEIHELAECMKTAYNVSRPTHLSYTGWHLPYIRDSEMHFPENELIKFSVARCARVSYKNHDKSNPNKEKDLALHDILLQAGHMSPFEHIAKPICFVEVAKYGWTAHSGITHKHRNGSLWSGNFKNWFQYRQLL